MPEETAPSGSKGPDAPRRPRLSLVAIVFVLLLIPLYFFYDAWLGRSLSTDQARAALKSGQSRRVWQAVHAIDDNVTQSRDRGAADPKWTALYPLVFDLARAEDPHIRTAAAFGLGRMKEAAPDAANRLRGFLHDGDRLVRIQAACSLANFGDASGAGILRELVSDERAEKVARRDAIAALAYVGDALDLDRFAAARLTADAETQSLIDDCAKILRRRIDQGRPATASSPSSRP